jgi:hypothetical protein
MDLPKVKLLEMDERNRTGGLLSLSVLCPFFHYYSYVHTRLGSFLPPAPTHSLSTRNYFALISKFVVERV